MNDVTSTESVAEINAATAIESQSDVPVPATVVPLEVYYHVRALSLELGHYDMQSQLLQTQAQLVQTQLKQLAQDRAPSAQKMSTLRMEILEKYHFDIEKNPIREDGVVVYQPAQPAS